MKDKANILILITMISLTNLVAFRFLDPHYFSGLERLASFFLVQMIVGLFSVIIYAYNKK